MKSNVSKVVERGDRLEDLHDKSGNDALCIVQRIVNKRIIRAAMLENIPSEDSNQHAYLHSLIRVFWGRGGGGGGGGGEGVGSDVAKVSCILCHRDIQLILAYSWARPAILVAGKSREVMFLFLLFLHFHSCSSFFPVPLFHLLYYLFSPFLWEMKQNDPQELTCR